MQRTIDDGYKIVIWPTNIKEKDINEMIMSGNSRNEILDIINSNTCSRLSATIKFKEWRKINA